MEWADGLTGLGRFSGLERSSLSRPAFFLVAVITSISILPAMALAAETEAMEVATPIYTEGDWFEYAGYDESVVAELAEFVANGTTPIDVDLNWSTPLRIEHLARSDCEAVGWSGQCISARMTHGLNATVRWPSGTSGYANDTMMINVTLEVSIQEPADRRSFMSIRESNQIIQAWFKAGGEDSLLELEVTSSEIWERSGDWPPNIVEDSVWVIEESIHRDSILRSRMNGGPWNETDRDLNESSTSTWRSNGTAMVHTGWDSSVEMRAMRIRIEPVSAGEWTELLLHTEGYPISTTTYEGGAPSSSLILLNHSYRTEQSVDVVVSGRGLGMMGWLSILLGVVVVSALAVATVRVSKRVTDSGIGSSGLPKHVLDSIAGAVGGEVYEELRGARKGDETEGGDASDTESETDYSGGILAMAKNRIEPDEETLSSLPSDDFANG